MPTHFPPPSDPKMPSSWYSYRSVTDSPLGATLLRAPVLVAYSGLALQALAIIMRQTRGALWYPRAAFITHLVALVLIVVATAPRIAVWFRTAFRDEKPDASKTFFTQADVAYGLTAGAATCLSAVMMYGMTHGAGKGLLTANPGYFRPLPTVAEPRDFVKYYAVTAINFVLSSLIVVAGTYSWVPYLSRAGVNKAMEPISELQ